LLLALGAAAPAHLSSSLLPPQDQARDDRGAIAMLRRDGIMFPFASFDRDEWEITWPIAFRDVKFPVTVNDVPEKWWGKGGPDRWRAHLLSGQTIDIALKGIGAFRPFCLDRVGLSTTYKPATAPPTSARPFPKDGIVIRGNLPVEPIESVDPASPEGREFEARLAQEFNKVEDRTVANVRTATGWRHPYEQDVRNARPIKLESWYRSPSSEPGWTVSYIEASRAFEPMANDKKCGLETFVSGWVHHFRGELRRASDLRGQLTYCDRVGVVYMLPFGRVRPRTRDYWVFQLSGWNDEWYDVAEVSREKVKHVIEVNAGGCMRMPR
jgi:hypothetical protein